jgi:rhamnulokinase
MRVLALDLGGGSGRLVSGSFDGKKLVVREIHRFPNELAEVDGHLVWDIPGIFSNLLDGMRRSGPEGFSSFGMDSYCNDYGLLDEGGELLAPVCMYRDRRTEGVLEWMDQVIPPEELFRRTGCQRARFNTLVQLVSQTRPPGSDLLRRAKSLLFIPDLIDFFLCGEKTAEYTIASVSQVYNRLENHWDPDIMAAFNIPPGLFPRVVPSATQLGQARRAILQQTGAGPFSICTVGHHDTASAVAAVPSLEEHFAYISSGTWSLLGTETTEMIRSVGAFQANFANEGGVGGRNRFSKNIMGLWLLQECQRQLAAQGTACTFAEMDAQAETAPAFRSIIDPDDPLFFQPGDFIGKLQTRCREWRQPVPETVGQITRCIKESLALAYRFNLEKLEELTGIKYPFIHIIGGGAKSTLLNRFTASALARPVLVGPFEATALGNLCVQFISAGEIADLQQARQVIRASIHMTEILPENEHAWDEAYTRFLSLKQP